MPSQRKSKKGSSSSKKEHGDLANSLAEVLNGHKIDDCYEALASNVAMLSLADGGNPEATIVLFSMAVRSFQLNDLAYITPEGNA